jgi:Protein of unknown function (DUF2934)
MGQQRRIKQHAQQPEENGQKNGQKDGALFETQSITGNDRTIIASLAYGLYEQRGREDGHDLEDWLEAEQRIAGRGGDRGF